MTTDIEQAKAAVRDAQGNYDRLCRALETLQQQLAQAEQTLNSARFRLQRATAATASQAQRNSEIAALTAALATANGNNRHD
ncbi:hypothetical protein LG197_26205 [Pseudomonas asiatica]|uniref:hypothetical protein n=1 Tax=Pseudomonas asiatica TaxID=2219225 RepID=UPI002368608A|nr:hypothetical protein [Pseudomonas asiatica]WDM88046.1 hypothetical protein LG197_26205 [Pseudomonas asiatica]